MDKKTTKISARNWEIAKEEGRFTIEDVVNTLAEKMVRRHPHVFGNEEYGSPEQNKKRWEEIKRAEKEMKKQRMEK